MVGWHQRLDGHEFEQAPGAGDGQGGLACCSPRGRKEPDTTERLNNDSQMTEGKLEKQPCLPFCIRESKTPGNKPTKEAEDLYSRGYKTSMKEIKDDTSRWRDILCSWIGRINVIKMTIMPDHNAPVFPGGSDGKESTCNAGNLGLIPGSGSSPGGEHGNPLQCSCLENPHGQRSLVGCSPRGHRVRHD